MMVLFLDLMTSYEHYLRGHGSWQQQDVARIYGRYPHGTFFLRLKEAWIASKETMAGI